ncbi:Phosphopantetheine adenylyltransferase-like protein [Elsinoe fawcettii]|nr:Phosphopantetheine adenylyltransferase-like protein [Elsinoe fawcettii]
MASTGDTAPRFLLLLPAAPSGSDAELISGVYGDSIRQVLKEVALASPSHQNAAVLEIALACPHLTEAHADDFGRYHATQEVVARIYRLVCIIAAKDRTNVEDNDGVDVRVILVSWDGHSSSQAYPIQFIPSLKDLATSSRGWQYAFGVENEAGEAMVRAFVQAKGASSPSNGPVESETQARTQRRGVTTPVPCVAVGGTFDHLHIGHKLLLTMTVFAALDTKPQLDTDRTVIIGITGDELLKNKKYAEHLESWHDRQRIVLDFVAAICDFSSASPSSLESNEVNKPGPNGHSVDTSFPNGLLLRCVEIGDPFGPTITEEDIDALIISAETRAGGKAVNDKRTEQGWSPLVVLEVDVLDADEPTALKTSGATSTEAFAGKISSTEIRRKLNSKSHQSVL